MLRLTIVTPERGFLDAECISATLPGLMGEMQILAGHASLLAELSPGIITLEKQNKEVVRCMVGEGFVEVDHDNVNVLCEQARHKSEIDKAHEESKLAELSAAFKNPDADKTEQNRIMMEISRCKAKLTLLE